jgi:thymidylate kinase
MAAADPERWGIVDATNSEDKIHEEILDLVLPKLPNLEQDN